jgi:hypothetical protein
MFLLKLCIVFSWISVAAALWPIPQQYEHGSSTVWLSPDAQLSVVDNSAIPGLKWVQGAVQQIL